MSTTKARLVITVGGNIEVIFTPPYCCVCEAPQLTKRNLQRHIQGCKGRHPCESIEGILRLKLQTTSVFESKHFSARLLLDSSTKPLEVPTEEFEASWWPLVDSFWTRTQKYCLTSGDNISVYVCRLSKPSKSSTRVEGVPLAKRRVTSKRTPIECHAAIKVTHTAEQTTKVERYKDAPDHCHPLEDIDVIKLPKAALQLVALEAKKPYKPPSIVVAVKEIAREQGLGEVVDHLTRTKVANI